MGKTNNIFKNNMESLNSKEAIDKQMEKAKKVMQYRCPEVYEQMKKGEIVPIVVGDMVIGFADSEKDMQKGLDCLSHFSDEPITKDNVMLVGLKMEQAMRRAYNLIDAENSGAVKLEKVLTIDDEDYAIDDKNRLLTMNGEVIADVSDIMSSREKLPTELFEELLRGRIAKYEAEYKTEGDYAYDDEDYDENDDENYDEDYDEEEDDEYDDENEDEEEEIPPMVKAFLNQIRQMKKDEGVKVVPVAVLDEVTDEEIADMYEALRNYLNK